MKKLVTRTSGLADKLYGERDTLGKSCKAAFRCVFHHNIQSAILPKHKILERSIFL